MSFLKHNELFTSCNFKYNNFLKRVIYLFEREWWGGTVGEGERI